MIISGATWVVAIILVCFGLFKLRKGYIKLGTTELTMMINHLRARKDVLIGEKKKLSRGEFSKYSKEARKKLDKIIEGVDKKIETYIEKGGKKEGRGDVENVRATREITLAAASFALASIFVSIGALLLNI